jgi:hypothetical protein
MANELLRLSPAEKKKRKNLHIATYSFSRWPLPSSHNPRPTFLVAGARLDCGFVEREYGQQSMSWMEFAWFSTREQTSS